MAEQDFTIKYVKDFIKQQFNMKWLSNNVSDSYSKREYRKAKIEDFNGEFVYLQVQYHENKKVIVENLPVKITNTTFKIYFTEDFSQQWQEFKRNIKSQDKNLNI